MDITSNYHHNNQQSVMAFEKVQPKIGSLHTVILNAFGDRKLTGKDVEELTGLSHQTCSARISELKAMGKLVATGARRDGCAVLVVA